jgi:hypothetical protein
MTKYTVTLFYGAPLSPTRYAQTTEVEETPNGGLEFKDSNGDEFTVSPRIPWVVVMEKGQQS